MKTTSEIAQLSALSSAEILNSGRFENIAQKLNDLNSTLD